MSSHNPKEMEEATEEKREEVIQTPDRALKYTLFLLLAVTILIAGIVGYAVIYIPPVTNTVPRTNNEWPSRNNDWKPESLLEKAMVTIGAIFMFVLFIGALFSGSPIHGDPRDLTLSEVYTSGMIFLVMASVFALSMFLFYLVIREARIRNKKEQ